MEKLQSKDLVDLSVKLVQGNEQPGAEEAFQIGYRSAEERLLPAIDKCETDKQMVLNECNERGKRLELMEPMLKKLIRIVAAPLLEDLERGGSDGEINIGEDVYTYGTMGRLIRDIDPVGLKFMNEWIIANDYLKNRTR